ncbi:hypothetical protein MBLNU459_g4680t1 [Dothideomycetes sp. NU459]
MSIQQVSASLAALSDSIKATYQLIGRLSKLNIQPGSAAQEEDGDVRLEITQDIHDGLKQNEDSLEALKQEAEDLTTTGGGSHRRRDSTKDRERVRIAAQLARLEEELKHARSQFRKAQLAAKRATEAAKQKERELIFATIQQSDQADPANPDSTDLFSGRRQGQTKQLTQDEVLVNASTDVTSALRRTHDLLTSELSRSRFAQETLDQSTAALADLGDLYGNLDDLLSSSKNLLGTLVRSQKSDTWYLETAFYILVVTLSWLVFRRLIYGPAWWFIWLPLKYFLFKPFIFIFSAFGIIGKPSLTSTSGETTVSRRPLRIQPSASGGIPTFAIPNDQRRQQPIPVGVGGRGAKVGKDGMMQDPSQDGSMSQKIGQMVEASRQEAQQQAQAVRDRVVNPRLRGDGTPLQDRGDIPKNPKKKMMEEEQQGQEQAEPSASMVDGDQSGIARDEL